MISVWPVWSGDVECQQFNSYRLNSTPRYQTLINDPFRLFLDKHTRTRIRIMKDGKEYRRAARVYVHPYGTPHHVLSTRIRNDMHLDKVDLIPGYMTRVSLDLNEIHGLVPPYGTCGFQKFEMVSNHYPYTINMCAIDCMVKYIYQQCNCVRFDIKPMLKDDRIKVCSITDMINCVIEKDFIARTESKSCIESCPRECMRYNYNLKLERTILPMHHNEQVRKVLGRTKMRR